MKVSVEISYYPLIAEYEPTIIQFINKLKEHQTIKVKTNSLSTQIVGDYDQVMKVLTEEIKTSLSEEQQSVMVLKILNKPVELVYRDFD